MFLLFAGPNDRADRAGRLAERAGYAVTRLTPGRVEGAGYLELFDVATDPSADAARWRRQTVAIATALMEVLGYRRLGVSNRHLYPGRS